MARNQSIGTPDLDRTKEMRPLQLIRSPAVGISIVREEPLTPFLTVDAIKAAPIQCHEMSPHGMIVQI
jgi:hypothetical protein